MPAHPARAQCSPLAANPQPLRSAAQSAAWTPLQTADDASDGVTADGSPARRCCAAPDPRIGLEPAAIAAEDWDLLFCSALEFLASVAVEKAASKGRGRQLQAPGTALRECMAALDQLRRSAPSVRGSADVPDGPRGG